MAKGGTMHGIFVIVKKYTTPRPSSANDVLMATFLPPPSLSVWQVEALPIWSSKERGWRESRRQLKIFGLLHWYLSTEPAPSGCVVVNSQKNWRMINSRIFSPRILADFWPELFDRFPIKRYCTFRTVHSNIFYTCLKITNCPILTVKTRRLALHQPCRIPKNAKWYKKNYVQSCYASRSPMGA